jgi:hypothetical protein
LYQHRNYIFWRLIRCCLFRWRKTYGLLRRRWLPKLSHNFPFKQPSRNQWAEEWKLCFWSFSRYSAQVIFDRGQYFISQVQRCLRICCISRKGLPQKISKPIILKEGQSLNTIFLFRYDQVNSLYQSLVTFLVSCIRESLLLFYVNSFPLLPNVPNWKTPLESRRETAVLIAIIANSLSLFWKIQG